MTSFEAVKGPIMHWAWLARRRKERVEGDSFDDDISSLVDNNSCTLSSLRQLGSTRREGGREEEEFTDK
jgi:hypothetical protein